MDTKSNKFKNKHVASSDDESSGSDDGNGETKKLRTVDYDVKKPGAHAKAGEWRKWKMAQRDIKQTRLEKKLKQKEKSLKEQELNEQAVEATNSSAEHKKPRGRNYTLSIAVPSTIISKVQSKELKTYVCGQIARAACLYSVDEIIVYNEEAVINHTAKDDNNQLMIKILEYLECPQYLRKNFFPHQRLLEFAGLLNPLDAVHHLKKYDEWDYREGVTTDISCKEDDGCWVDIGLPNKILVNKKIQPGVRVTVKKQVLHNNKTKGLIVSPITPRVEDGLFWGYQVRYADSFRKILHECPFDGGYDLKIASSNNCLDFSDLKTYCYFKHAVIVFSGSQSIQDALEADEKLRANNAEQLFDHIIDKQADIGSRSVRSEEAILITLAHVSAKLANSYVEDKADDDDTQIVGNGTEENGNR